jgi:uncharacterized protein YabN with tetrapyrrole methylase and pyrophosphatase domain
LLEEAHECAEAIDRGDDAASCEELGDLLFNIAFQLALAEQERRFTWDEVIEKIVAKLIRRHPHVFGESKNLTMEQIRDRWHRIKAEERGSVEAGAAIALRPVPDLPRSLPALVAAIRWHECAQQEGAAPGALSAQQEFKRCEESLQSVAGAAAAAAAHAPTLERQLGQLLLQVAVLCKALGHSAETLLKDHVRAESLRLARLQAGRSQLANPD